MWHPETIPLVEMLYIIKIIAMLRNSQMQQEQWKQIKQVADRPSSNTVTDVVGAMFLVPLIIFICHWKTLLVLLYTWSTKSNKFLCKF